jgi:hypothetical protein
MLQYNPTVTGSLQVSGDITGTVNGINITGLSQSVSTQLISVQVSTGSSDAKFETLSGVTSSALTRLTNIETKSASVDISISNINSITASNIARLSNLETKSSSVDISLSSINSKTGSYATTGSNQFYGTQVFSGSVFIANDLIVQGSSSIQYISASSVSIGTNIVQLNTANPSVRFAGLTIIDSGSVGGSGSFLYDSVHDEFIFVHRGNGTNVTSSHFVLGPETYDSLGNETYLTTNTIPKGTGKEHLVDSCIFDNGTTTCIKNNLIGTGTISGTTIYGSNVACSPIGCFATSCATSFIGGTMSGTTIYGSTAVCSTVGKFTSCIDAGAATFACSVGIGISPSFPLEISSATGNQLKMSTNDATSANNAGIFFYNESSATSSTRRSYMLLDPNGANGSGGDYAYFDMYGSGTVRVMNQLTSGVLALGVGGTNIINITGSNVGIGTSSPTRLLDVSNTSGDSTIVITSADATGQSSLFYGKPSDANIGGVLYNHCNNQMSFRVNDATRMSIASTGDVGIGTCTPSSISTFTTLEIRGATGGGIKIGKTACSQFNVQHDGTDAYFNNTANGALYIYTSDADRFRITSTGIACFACQVCAPSFKGGTIYGTAGYFSCHIELNDNGSGWIYGVDKNHSIILRGDRTGCVADFTNYYQYGGNLSTGKGHNFWTDGVLASQTIKMQIANNGICITVPLYVCTNGSAFGTATGSGQAMTIQAGSNCRAIIFKNPAGADGSLWLYGTSNTINYSFSTYSVGDAFVLYNNGTYDFAGGDASDIRLKENITTIDYNATEKLMRLVPKSYNMIKYPDTKRSGFIAQEVKEVLPDFAIGEETEKDYLGLDYNGLLAISIKAIQEQQCRIKLLESCLGIS